MNRYLLNLKKEIDTQIRLLKPNTLTEAQTKFTLDKVFNPAWALQMTPEEVREQIDYEDSAKFLPYAEDSDLLEQEEQEATNC